MQNCIMCQERQPAEGSEFCHECQREMNADREFDTRHFDAHYEWSKMGGDRDISEHPAYRDFRPELRESIVEHRRERIRKERRESK